MRGVVVVVRVCPRTTVGLDGCEVRLCDPCARVRPCVPCVSRLPLRYPPVSFFGACTFPPDRRLPRLLPLHSDLPTREADASCLGS